MAEWQTRTVQVRVSERTWGFNSPHPHEREGDLCSRKARTAPLSSFLRGFAAEGGGFATRTPWGLRFARPLGLRLLAVPRYPHLS